MKCNYLLWHEIDLRSVTLYPILSKLNYWSKLIMGKQSKYSCIIYKLLYHLYCTKNIDFKWLICVKNMFDECGFSYIWNTQLFLNDVWLKYNIKVRLCDQFKQSWNETIQNCSKALNYRIFKNLLCFEEYFNILDEKDFLTLCKFRICNHKLPVELGRWYNIEREKRKCNLCKLDIGDEFHYIINCSHFREERNKFINRNFSIRPNIILFTEIMSSTNRTDLINLCKFIRILNKRVCPPE